MDIVLLPGMDGTGLLFKPFIEKLNKEIRTSVVSYPVDTVQSYQDLIQYVKERLPENRDFLLVAESFSGSVAHQLASSKLRHLKGIIYVASFLENPRPMLLFFLKYLPIVRLIKIRLPDLIIRKLFIRTNADTRLIELFRRAIHSVNPDVLAGRLKILSDLKVDENRLDIPCCYIQPSSDWLIPKRCIAAFIRRIPGIKIQSIEGPHFILQSNPQACADIIKEEIGRLTNVE